MKEFLLVSRVGLAKRCLFGVDRINPRSDYFPQSKNVLYQCA